MGTINKEQARWFVLALLVVILTAIIVVHLSNTPAATRADSNPIYGQQRDLSTPSSRLVGHWISESGSHQLYYTSSDPSLKIGTFKLHNCNGEPSQPMWYKILYEDPAEDKLVIRQFRNLARLEATTGLDLSESDVLCTISKDGLLMSKEHTFLGNRSLTVYRYVDDNTTP
jgi:hypothetical protein